MKTLALVLLGFALVGCSQVDALAPVGGDQLAIVRFAANDLLVEQKVEILSAPVCEATGDSVKCQGATVGGEAINVTSEGDSLDVTVGSRTIYDGSLTDVIDANARPRP